MTPKGECLACLMRVGFDGPPQELASLIFGDYEIARREDGSPWELGRGAMGVTYRAKDRVLHRTVALKIVDAPQKAERGQAVRDRFLREARAAAAFHHPNVAGVFQFGASTDGDRCYYAMELVDGDTLEALVRREGPLKPQLALEIARQVTRALIAAAGYGLIHRDLKPGNIMLTHSGADAEELEVKVIDFGLAKAVATNASEMDLTQGAFLGTPAFASPEQFSGAPADARSDIYSLGVTLWYALTGEVPFAGRTIEEMRRCQSELPLPVGKLVAHKIPKPVIELLRRLLAVDPAERPASAREFMQALERCRSDLGYTSSNGASPKRRILKLSTLFVELKRRNVYRVAAAYAVVAWLLIQVATQTFPVFEIPTWAARLVVLALILGFPIALVFAWVFELTPEGLKRTDEIAPNQSITRSTSRKLDFAIIGLLVVVISFLVVTRYLPKPAVPLATSNAPAPIPEKSVAILPFTPLSLQNRDEVLESGMADTLIAKLSTTGEIIIPSLTSARKYAEQERDPLAVARLLGVRAVLEGSVQLVGDRLRVTARLINVADRASLWAGTYDEKFTDVFAVQDAIAEKVAAALALRLSGDDRSRLTKRATENTEAYKLYLSGRFHWNKFTEEGFRKAIDFFKLALEKDPAYALAYSGLADAYSMLADIGAAVPNEAFPKARVYAESALKLDDTLADAHLSLGIVKLLYEADFPGAEIELRRAKELNPNNAHVYHFYGHYLQLTGRREEAIVEMKRGGELDPTSSGIMMELGTAYLFTHQYDAAIAQMRRTLELNPSDVFPSVVIADLKTYQGKPEEALRDLDKLGAAIADNPWAMGARAHAYAASGQRAEAEKLLAKAKSLPGEDPRVVAWIHVSLGDKDQAFAELSKLLVVNRALIPWIDLDLSFHPLRSDPRYAELFRRAGFEIPK
jgi:TolB-like protein